MKISIYKLQLTAYNFFLPFTCFILLIYQLHAQQKNLPLNRMLMLNTEREANKIDTLNMISNFKPFIESKSFTISKVCELRRIKREKNNSSEWKKEQISLFRKKLKHENLIIVNDTIDRFHLTIDPLFHFELGKDLKDSIDEKLYKNIRGILVRGDIGKNFSFESSFLENQASFARYIDDYILGTDTAFKNTTYYPYHVIPGQGRSKVFKKNGYDFGYSSGYVSYSPNSHFNFQFGHGKHFVGDGYRSLLLSDNPFNYPFVRITSSFRNLQYTNLYTSFINLTDGGVKTAPGTERLFQKKAASFQLLSWNVHKKIQIGLFQGMIWKASDKMNRQQIDWNYFNPLIFANAGIYSLSHENNIIIGTTLKLKITRSISLYGQYMIDDAKKDVYNKNGWQTGVKYFNAMGIPNLHFQLEYNQVRPYSYSARNVSQSYTHYNQPLAHPFGANFREGILFLNYQIGNFFAELKFNWAYSGINHVQNFGSSPFLSDTLNIPKGNISFPFGHQKSLIHTNFHAGYLVNPSTNFNIIMGISTRSETKDASAAMQHHTNIIYFGICTSLNNFYYDF